MTVVHLPRPMSHDAAEIARPRAREPAEVLGLDQSPESVCEALAWANGFTLVEVRSRSRRAPLVRVRRSIASYLRDERGWTFQRIGRFLNRHHSCVVYWLRGR